MLKRNLLFGLALFCVLQACLVHADSIPLIIDRYLPDDRDAAAVRFGVPFPINTLAVDRAGDVRIVDDLGQVTIPQAKVTATWNPSGDMGVRWLLIDMQAMRGRQYKLVFNEVVAPFMKASEDIAVAADDCIEIKAGAIQGKLTTRGFDPFHQLSVLGAPMAVPLKDGEEGQGDRDFSAFYVEHETKGIFRSDLDKDAIVVLEETGPQRAIIRVDGWYTNTAGEKFCRYRIRLHITRNNPHLRIDHTWIFTGLSSEDRIRSISMQIRRCSPQVGNAMRGFTGNNDLLNASASADFTGYIKIVQDTTPSGWSQCVLEYGNKSKQVLGEQGGGWMTMHGTLGTHIALRDAWQQFPWGMEAEAGIIRVHFWPPGARLLDTSWDGYWQLLTEKQKLTLTAGKPRPANMTAEQYMEVLRQKTNATGAAKTHELHISFSGPGYGGYLEQLPRGYGGLAREVAYPAVACADPQWMARTRAMDWMPHASRNYETFRDEENYFDAILHLVTDSVEKNNWHGFWEWGGYHQFMNPGPVYPSSHTWDENAGMASWHRARPKSHYLWGGFPWIQFMRSGDRKWLRYAQTYTLYSSDRAHSHHDGHGRKNGAEYHYDNSEVPWLGGYQRGPGGDQIASNLQAKDDYVYMYWLTGDRHALDVLEASADLICNSPGYGVNKAGIQVGNEIRNAGMLLHRLCMAYQATWNPRYLERAKKIAAMFYPLDEVEKVAQAEKMSDWHFHAALGWAYEGMWFYWNLTHDPQFKAPLLAFINRGRDYGAGMIADYGTTRALAYGFMLTQDVEYLNLARGILDDQVSEAVSPYSFLPANKMNLLAMPRIMGAMTIAPEAWRQTYLPTHVNGRVLTYRAIGKPNNQALTGHRFFIREGMDKPWSFSLVVTFGGHFVLYRPDGKVAVEQTIDEGVRRYVRFDVPVDGLIGDYQLICKEAGKGYLASRQSEYQPWARVVGCPWPVTVEAFFPRQLAEIQARAFYFYGSSESQKLASISMSEMDFRRPFRVSDTDKIWQYDSTAHVPGIGGSRRVVLPRHSTQKVYGLEWEVPPFWLRNRLTRPSTITLNNTPHFIAADPRDLFIPQIVNPSP